MSHPDAEYVAHLGYPESEKCYLDGWYFGKVFEKYEGYVKEPVKLKFGPTENSVSFKFSGPRKDIMIFRVIIKVKRPSRDSVQSQGHEKLRHTNAVIVDSTTKTLYRVEPIADHEELRSLEPVIDSELRSIFRFLAPNYEYVVDRGTGVQTPGPEVCAISGYCNADVIWRTLQLIGGVPLESEHDSRRLVSYFEDKFGLPPGKPDITYGWSSSNIGSGALIGGLGGAAIGGLGGGLGGALGGAALGALGGAVVGSLLSPRRPYGYRPGYGYGDRHHRHSGYPPGYGYGHHHRPGYGPGPRPIGRW